ENETAIVTARSAGSDGERSRFGSVLGTPAYMAPEQARGETDILDERCDVFALGSILCEVLAGQPAVLGRGSARGVRDGVRGRGCGGVGGKGRGGDVSGAVARLHNCGADGELIALARDCLAAEAGDRPRNAGVVATRCQAYLGSLEQRMRAAELDHAASEA